jgi:hypothetical protein
MTIDEELTLLDDGLRRLKIEFDIFFNGGSQRPPNDSQWRVESLIKRYSESSKLTYAQRFRYNAIAQRYAMFNDLWRQKLKVKEEGPRRTAADLREQEKEKAKQQKKPAFRVEWKDPAAEAEKVEQLFAALLEAKKQCGETVDNVAADQFKKFVALKTAQLKKDFKCEQVEYVVEVEQGQVRLKAKGI